MNPSEELEHRIDLAVDVTHVLNAIVVGMETADGGRGFVLEAALEQLDEFGPTVEAMTLLLGHAYLSMGLTPRNLFSQAPAIAASVITSCRCLSGD
jgi:hypothetical protein